MSHVKTIQKEAAVVLPTAGETYVAEDGTVSQVLEDVIDENYEPTQEEIHEYAEWMGMQLPEEEELLWIAREGLKTPLPKEWKPCKTDEGEIYYFNFRTGESSWYHPMDSIMRKRYEAEKAKLAQAKKQPVAKANPSVNSSTSGGGGGGGAATANRGAGKAPQAKPSVSAGAVGSAFASPLSSPAAAGLNGAGGGGARAGLPSAFASQSQPQSPRPIVSEAERKLEEQIRAEIAKSFAEEKEKLEKMHEARREALHKIREKDMAEAKAADEARRTEGSTGFDEERQRRVEEVRARCDAKFGAQLRELERQAEQLQTQLQKAEEEKARMQAQSGGERAAIEQEAAATRARELQKLEKEVADAKRKQLNIATSAFATRKAALEKAIAEAMDKARAEKEAESRRQEVSDAMAIEARRKRLEATKRDLELDIRNASKAARPSGALGASSSGPSSPIAGGSGADGDGEATIQKKVAAIEAKRDATCLEIRSQAARELAALEKRHVDQRTALQRALAAEKEKEAAGGAALPSPASPAPTTTSPQTLQQRMSALRARFTKEKMEAMNKLKQEREARLAEAKSSAASTPLRSPTLDFGGGTPQRSGADFDVLPSDLSPDAAAKVDEHAALLHQVEEDWIAATAGSVEAAAATPQGTDAAVEAAVKADMAAFAKRLTARRTRERAALEARRDAMLAEHAAALKEYEEQKAAAAKRVEEETRETKAAMMQDAVEEAAAKELATLKRDASAARTRRLASYTREEEAIKEGIEEEMNAYLQAELQRLEREAQASSASPAVSAEPKQGSSTKPTAGTSSSGARHHHHSNNAAALAGLNADIAHLSARLEALQARRRQLEEQQRTDETLAEQRLISKREQRQQLERTLAGRRAATPSTPPPPLHTRSTVPSTRPLPSPRIVTKLVPPAGSVAKAVHAARIAALEESYRAQEAALRQELHEARAAAAAAAVCSTPFTGEGEGTSVTPPLPPAANANTMGAVNVYARHADPHAQPQNYPHLPPSPRGFSTADALRLLQSQSEQQRRRQSALLSARRAEAADRRRGASVPASAPPRPSSVPEPQRLLSAVATLNRTLDALHGRVTQLERSTATAAPVRRTASASPAPRGHPSGLPTSPLRTDRAAAESDLRRRWDSRLSSYQGP